MNINRGMVQKPYLMMIGGGQIPLKMVNALSYLAGGEGATAAIVPAASRNQGPSKYEDVLKRGGLDPVTLPLYSREDSENEKVLSVLETSEIIFFGGGSQIRLAAAIIDTPCEQVLLDRLNGGIILAGTSAGAAVMGEFMPSGGTGKGALHSGRKDPELLDVAPTETGEKDSQQDSDESITIASGLGFVQGVAVDQHFHERSRFGRLAYVTSRYRERRLIGVGIDESTACLVDWESEKMTVLGEGCVTVLTAERFGYDNVQDRPDSSAPLASFGLSLDVLAARHGYDLRKPQPLAPEDARALVAAALDEE